MSSNISFFDVPVDEVSTFVYSKEQQDIIDTVCQKINTVVIAKAGIYIFYF